MGFLIVGPKTTIEVEDHLLDRVADLVEQSAADGSGGFWLAGQLEVERDGEPVHADPSYGHQRMWVAAGTLLSLVYDRRLHPDPDSIAEDPRVIYL